MRHLLQGTPRVGHACALLPASGVFKIASLRSMCNLVCSNMGPSGGMAPGTSPYPEGARPGPVRGPCAAYGRRKGPPRRRVGHPGPAGRGEPEGSLSGFRSTRTRRGTAIGIRMIIHRVSGRGAQREQTAGFRWRVYSSQALIQYKLVVSLRQPRCRTWGARGSREALCRSPQHHLQMDCRSYPGGRSNGSHARSFTSRSRHQKCQYIVGTLQWCFGGRNTQSGLLAVAQLVYFLLPPEHSCRGALLFQGGSCCRGTVPVVRYR